jgi:hypothetical protein
MGIEIIQTLFVGDQAACCQHLPGLVGGLEGYRSFSMG